MIIHASALVFVLENEDSKEKFNLIELNRISTIAKKDCVIAYIKKLEGESQFSKSPQVDYDCISRCAVSWHKVEGKRRKK